MNPIRPTGLPFTPPTGQAPDAARSAAQKAFFDAAMGRAPAPAAPQTLARTAAAAPAAAPVQRAEIRPAPRAEAPAKVLRPGSLLDIRI